MKNVWILNLIAGLGCIAVGILCIFREAYLWSTFGVLVGITNLYFVYKQWKNKNG